MNQQCKTIAAVAALGIMIWQGRDIRAALTLTGEGWDRLHPEVRHRAINVLRKAKKAGLSVGIFEGYRSAETQAEYMRKGTSKVSDPNSSYHRWGLAVDFVFLDRLGRWTWEPAGGRADWDKLGAIIESEGFQWGGRFKSFFDGPHAQLPIVNIAQLKQQYSDNPEAVTWA